VTIDPLEVARELARIGVPLFLAPPDPSKSTGFALPNGWQRARPDPTVPDHWRPGWALCAVTGHALDLVDLDPRNGWDWTSDVRAVLPFTVATAETPSGGEHLWVPAMGVESRDGVFPGMDVKSGTSEGFGRGFGFIAPTERRSKVDGVVRPYRWLHSPGDLGPHPGRNDAALITRIRELRAESTRSDDEPRVLARSAAAREWRYAVGRLQADIRYWSTHGWGGAAHAGLLAHTTHLARLAPDHAEDAFAAAFASAGLEPDGDDLAKLESALAHVVPDEVVNDEELSTPERFWLDADGVGDPVNREDERDAAELTAAGWSDADAYRFTQAGRWRRDRA